MHLVINGGTKKKREMADSIARFVAKKLMPRLAPKLEINIQLVRNLGEKEGVYGDCMWEDDDHRPKEFSIRVDSSLSLRSFCETVAHEMVHVKQYARGELKQLTAVNKYRFAGQRFPIDMDYWDMPWEIEAHGREAGLFIRWVEFLGITDDWVLDKA